MIKKIIFIVSFALLPILVQANEGVKSGEKAPEISAKDMNGKSVKLDEFKGKAIVIRFWEKGCHHCMMEMPKLQELQDEYKDDLAVIGINSYNSIEDIKQFQDEYKIDFTLAKDDLDISKKRYGVVIVPTMFIINKEGIVKYKIFGMSSWEKSKERILEVL
ncbi:MAG: TlpA family protein disulfide reductase [Campylobacteraceae bacterium]|jgi:peroxiredoxin|nr:TlpA family protein disulfide reductase [Campylobacteraceae bacterium]